MSKTYDRRDFLKSSTVAAAGVGLGAMDFPERRAAWKQPEETVRLGFVGIGGRGSYHLSVALGLPGVEVPAICDYKADALHRAKRWVEAAGQPTPTMYGDGKEDFRRLCGEEDLDAIICCTSWKWHAPVCLCGMRNDMHVVSEVPMILTVDEAWDVVETHEKTGYWATIALEGWDFTITNMVQQGVFGEIRHAEDGYIHDLRLVKFDPEEEPWRLWHSIHRNGDLYPDHPMNNIMAPMDINHGDRFDYLVSMSSKSGMLNQYAAEYYGEEHPYAKADMKQGDYNAALIRTVNGKMVTLNFDTNTPHPRGTFRMQGTEGVYTDGSAVGEAKIYLDGPSPESHEWELAEPYLQEYEHPVWQNYQPPEREDIRGHGGGGSTPIEWPLLLWALRNDKMPIWDVYDSVTSAVLSPLTEKSVANRSQTVDVPDFTRGGWKESEPLTWSEEAEALKAMTS